MPASHRPVFLFVDDVHLADRPSARSLVFLARRLRFSRVLLVMTEPAEHYQINELFAADLLRQRHCHQIRAPAVEVARYLLAAGQRLSSWGASVLRQAAAALAAKDEIDDAVACLELAIKGSESDGEQGSLMAGLLKLEWRTEMTGRSRWPPRLLCLAAQGVLTREDAGVLLRHLLWEGDFRSAEELLLQITALPIGQGAPDDGAIIISQAEKFLEACPLKDLTIEPLTQVLNAVIAADRPALAARWCDHFMIQAARHRAPVWQGALASTRAAIALRQGDFELARSQASEGLAHIPPKR
ncbi:hypothetical protein FAIPA1_400046 [Frankia sp. AiPs1]|uniref:hypothetical protein n=1 Tax=Frankia sp. AiPa1 TaxID=573492 RepID=UPI00202B4EB3|nr:hypothetical protein [Frankia sp. AiPa1]MCL9762735.1 hypothetical protein [Frankia sp. AiPa1]